MKRKRATNDHGVDARAGSNKRRPIPSKEHKTPSNHAARQHAVLSTFYPSLRSLREYVLLALDRLGASRPRKRAFRARNQGASSALDSLLDTTLVGVRHAPTTWRISDAETIERSQAFVDFSQRLSACTAPGTASSNGSLKAACMSELVDFSVWLLFHRQHASAPRPPHVLCAGFARCVAFGPDASCAIPGLTAFALNPHVATLKGEVWTQLARALGRHSDNVVLDLLVNCGVFAPLGGDAQGCLYQLSGAFLFLPLPD